MALLPDMATAAGGNTQTQGSISPTSSGGGSAERTPPPSLALRGRPRPVATIPPTGRTALTCIVAELLLSSLERYLTAPKEAPTDREARRERAARGMGLSQMEEDEPAKRDGNPFRFDKCLQVTSRPSMGNSKKKSQSTTIGQSLLTEALNRINEPLPFLIASCIATTPLLANAADGNEEDVDDVNPTAKFEMKTTLNRIRCQMARCTDIHEYTKWTKSSRRIFEIKDIAKRAVELATSKLATLLLVAAVADVFLGTCTSGGEEKNATFIMVIASETSTNNDIEDLFSLRTEAIDEAADIMSSFVSAKSQRKASSSEKKLKLKEVDVNSSSQQTSKQQHEEPQKKKGRGGIVKVKTSEINEAIRVRNRRSMEDAVQNIGPAMNHNFLADSLRKFGAEVAKKVRQGILLPAC